MQLKGSNPMLTGNDFVILTRHELKVLYLALTKINSNATYKDLQDMGALNLVDEIRQFLK